jgi:hypothetical protein
MLFDVIKGRIETNSSLKVHNFIVGILSESYEFPIPAADSTSSKNILHSLLYQTLTILVLSQIKINFWSVGDLVH